MDKTYLDEVDWCLKHRRHTYSKMVPVRDKAGWHLYFIEVPAEWKWCAVVLP